MDVEITKANGSSYRLSDHDVVIRDFAVSSIEMRPSYSEVDGRHGYVDMGATYGSRTIRIPFYIDAHDLSDVALLRDKLFELVTDVEPFYIREMRRPEYASMHFCDGDEYADKYAGGKRYKVRLSTSPFEIEQMFTYGFGEMTFETTDLPFAESIGTTADIERDGLKGDIWGKETGISDADASKLKYSFRVTYANVEDNYFITPFQNEENNLLVPKFSVYNAGNVLIHPFEQPLKIRLYNASNSLDFIKLENISNGSYIKLNKGLWTSELIIDGPNVILDGVQALRETDRTFIRLEPGWNFFEVSGAEAVNIDFDFRFYYL